MKMEQANSESIQKSIEQYRRVIQKEAVRNGYAALMRFIEDLRLHLANSHPDSAVSAVQQGLMDFSYFTFTPQKFRQRKLKVVILFIHDSFSFEVWLSGQNKTVAAEALKWLHDSGWRKHELAPNAKEADYITKVCLASEVDFSQPGCVCGAA